MAVYASDFTGFNLASITAPGGSYASGPGGAGTVYLRDVNQPQGNLVLDAAGGGSGVTPLGLPGQTVMQIPDAVVARGTNIRPEHAGMTFDIGGGLTVSGGATMTADGAITLGGPLTVAAASSLLAGGAITAPSLAITNGGLLTSFPGTSAKVYELQLNISGTLSVDATSRIDVSGQGYLPGYTTGNTKVGGATGDSGGSYGGLGDGGAVTNAVYGDYADPNDWGSGGGNTVNGFAAPGGGLVRITAGTLELDGQLLADGSQGNYGGSGGGIYVAVATLSGAGQITAAGAADGGGGGGRVAVYASSFGDFNLGSIRAPGGSGAGAGTVYLRDVNQPQGTLVLDAAGGGSGVTPLGLPGQTVVQIPDAVVARGTNIRPEHAGMTFDIGGGLTVSGGATMTADGAITLGGPLTLASGGSLQALGGLTTTAAATVDGSTLAGGSITVSALTVTNGSLLTSQLSTTTNVYQLDLNVTGTVSVDATSRIDVSGQGYLPGYTTGNTTVGAATGTCGGSYGGLAAGGLTNAVYADYADPDDWGSGGAANGGAPGGGLVRITAGTLELDGQILANGARGSNSGSGGGIYIAVATLKGAGQITAAGPTQTGSLSI